MTTIYTKTGDEGQTGLIGGKRVAKFDIRVEAYGTIDEAVAVVAMARSKAKREVVQNVLKRVEEELFLVGSELACPEPEKLLKRKIELSEIEWMETTIDEIMSRIAFKRDFIVPGPYISSALLHMARTVVRRAERRAAVLKARSKIRPELLKYLNRLSDLLYAMALLEEQEEMILAITKKVRMAMEMSGDIKKLTLDIALKITDSARKKAEEIKKPMAIAVADQGGCLITLHRMDKALLASVEIAKDKAFTAAVMKMPTEELAKLAAPGGQLYGINSVAGGRIIIFGGGIPIWSEGEVVGSIGVSGGSVDEDIEVARAGLEAI
ncbi:MAG: cob(I)yrinic acid a,c-diamide adenosyltransferase [Tepidanaerobacteraceae bacterium]|jgi:cob(I)alamin adenosyltransferase|nr:cob(I)yrinic acid a,c-diamide adenosyltransferase [Tepidanaerobacteraceae bacterium]